jgi:two-component system sensor histidine kinase MprB
VTFRTRLVLATTVAVVVAVLVASTASFLAARDSLLGAADNSLTAAAKKITAGQQISATTATLGQVIDSQGTLVSGGQLPISAQARLVAAGRASSFFTTVDVEGDQLRELVEPLPAGTLFGSLDLTEGGALQIATLVDVGSELDRLGIVLGAVALIGVLLAVVLGWLVAQTALVPLNALTDTVEDLAGTTDLTRRLSPGGPDELGRLRRTFNRLLRPSSSPAGPRSSWSWTPPTNSARLSPACAPTSRSSGGWTSSRSPIARCWSTMSWCSWKS